jgi:hypothetical protein
MQENQTDTIQFVKITLAILSGLFSFIVMILVFVTDFGGWWTGNYSWNYYYFIGSEMAPGWAQFFLVLLGLIYLGSTGVAVVAVLTDLGKVTKFTQIANFVGIVIGIVAFVFTGITTGMFAIVAAGYEWWLATSFYASLVGSLLITTFFILHLLLGRTTQEK